MPADSGGDGHFENLAANLQLSDSLTEKYFAAADLLIEKVFNPGWEGDQGRRRLFIARPGPKLAEREAALKVLTDFARRAYRRPPSEADVARLMRFYDKAKAGGAAFEASVRAALKPALVSPRFLFRFEEDRPALPGRCMPPSMPMNWPSGCRTSSGPGCPTMSCSRPPRTAALPHRRGWRSSCAGCSPTAGPPP
jgi:hypothetical protein